jgi:hypothetical protein
MRMNERLDKLEKHTRNKGVLVVKYGNDVVELTYGKKSYLRNDDESECAFIERIKYIVSLKQDSHNILVANF